jgi:cyanosortase A-associated protein
MPKPTWKEVQIPLLAVVFTGVAVVLTKTLFTPTPDKTALSQPTPNLLPAQVPIKGWQALESSPSPLNEELKKEAKAGQRYRYRKGTQELDVDLHYMTSDGNISRYLFVYTPVRTANADLEMKYQPGVGHYGVVTHRDVTKKTTRAYLSACINPQGESTITEQQFTHNLSKDLQPAQVVSWILGQKSLIDRRCLWTLMSVPVVLESQSASAPAARSQQQAYQTLETAWLSWYQWWRENYPRF